MKIDATILSQSDIDAKNDKLKESAKKMEGYFVELMLKEMRKTVPNGGVIQKSQGETIFQDLFDQSIAQKIVDRNGFGLADSIYAQTKIEIPPPVSSGGYFPLNTPNESGHNR